MRPELREIAQYAAHRRDGILFELRHIEARHSIETARGDIAAYVRERMAETLARDLLARRPPSGPEAHDHGFEWSWRHVILSESQLADLLEEAFRAGRSSPEVRG